MNTPSIAIWSVTPGGIVLAEKIARAMPAALFVSESVSDLCKTVGNKKSLHIFEKLSEAVSGVFRQFDAHIFIMSAGIAVRMIAPHLRSKTSDPAVVVIDDAGRHAVSLLSGHIGGANDLTTVVANLINAVPVITTATDVNGLPAIDVFASRNHLRIENPEAIKSVNMAILTRQPVYVRDPFGFAKNFPVEMMPASVSESGTVFFDPAFSGVFIDDRITDLPPKILKLRPRTLTAGMGCNRHTDMIEMKMLLTDALNRYSLSPASLKCIATITAKKDEPGLIALSEEIGVPLIFYTSSELNSVTNIPTPSDVVEKHMGVKSVCEAAAILASDMGNLIVPKQTTRNATLAIARIPSILSASDPAASVICPDGQSKS